MFPFKKFQDDDVQLEYEIYAEYQSIISLNESFSNGVETPPAIKWMDKYVRSKFPYHDTLDPDIWVNPKPNQNHFLRPEIRKYLLAAAEEFVDYIIKHGNLDPKAKSRIFQNKASRYDVEFKGSACNYNYNKDSDIDVHIVVPDIPETREMTRARIDFKNANANRLKIKTKINPSGYPLEFFFREQKQQGITDAIYSLKYGVWRKSPTYKPHVDMNRLTKAFSSMYDKLYNAYDKGLKHEFKSDRGTFPKGKTAGILYADQYRSELMKIRDTALNNPPFSEFDEINLAVKALRRTKLYNFIDANRLEALRQFRERNQK